MIKFNEISTQKLNILKKRFEVFFPSSSEKVKINSLSQLLKINIKDKNDLFYAIYVSTGRPPSIEKVETLYEILLSDFDLFYEKFKKAHIRDIKDSINRDNVYKSKKNEIYTSVTFTSKCHFNTGIQRTVREICSELKSIEGEDFKLIIFDDKKFRFASVNEKKMVVEYHSAILEKGLKRIKAVKTFLVKSYHFLLKFSVLAFFVSKSKNFIRYTIDKFFSLISSDRGNKNTIVVFTEGCLFIPEVFVSGESSLLPQISYFTKISTTALCYDIMPITHPHYFHNGNRQFLDNYIEGLKFFSKISCISNYTKDQLKILLKNTNHVKGMPSCSKLMVNYLGCNLKHMKMPENKIYEKSFISIGTVEKRKNHSRIIESLKMLAVKYPQQTFRYDIVGSPGQSFEDVKAQVKKANSNISNLKIIIHGSIHDKDVNLLYQSQRVSLYISLAEGFGLPLIESAAMKIPYITSNQTATKEIGGLIGGGILVDPLSEKSIFEAMETLCFDEEVYDKKQSELAKFKWNSWKEYSEELISLIRS